MDPVLQDIYSTVLAGAPYVIAAYALLWIGLMGYVALAMRRLSGIEKQISILETAMARKGTTAE